MRFITARDQQGEFIGVVDETGENILRLVDAMEAMTGKSDFPTTMLSLIQQGDLVVNELNDLISWLNSLEDKHKYYVSLGDVTLLAPIPRPTKNIMCIGKNYAEHAIEMGSADDIPEHIMVFTKAPTTVVGHHYDVMNHAEVTNELDYEGELAIVIGKQGKGIAQEAALDYVFGYTILNDITARDLQARHKQFFLGKSLDTTCPIGPWIVHRSVISNPNNLFIQTKVNDEIRQESNTKHFIFPIEEIISVLSRGMTLEPGDIIATGTPAGVGKGFKPPRFLKSGDQIEIQIEGIGCLKNRIK